MWIQNINTRNEGGKNSSPDFRAGQPDNSPHHLLRRGAKTSQIEI
jgi:hypothetical protein